MAGSEEVTDEQIAHFLSDPPAAQSSTGSNLFALVVSLLIFAGAGLFGWSIPELAILILVLFIHEGGHLLAMKVFGYKDLRMLFLPFLGAIASGRSGTRLSWQQAIVSLAGPVPGIMVGLILMAGGGHGLPAFAGVLFLYLNLFNLLPIYPLDGGRFLDDLLFSRSFRVEMVTKILASVGIVALAYFLDWWLLAILLLGTLASLKRSRSVNATMTQIRSDPSYQGNVPAVPTAVEVALIRNNISADVMSGFSSTGDLVGHIGDVWTRMAVIHPSVGQTAVLLLIYGCCILLGISVLGVGEG